MGEQDLKVVRALWDAWDRREMPAMFELYDPEVTWDMRRSDVADMGVFHGHRGVRQFFTEWFESFDEYYAHAEDFVDAGDHVVVQVRQGGRGKGSGVNVEMPVYWQSHFVRGGKVVRVEIHRDRDEALAAAPDDS